MAAQVLSKQQSSSGVPETVTIEGEKFANVIALLRHRIDAYEACHCDDETDISPVHEALLEGAFGNENAENFWASAFNREVDRRVAEMNDGIARRIAETNEFRRTGEWGEVDA